MKIVDCTSFYSEHMMYEVRLNILKDKVDKFIVTESTYSHSGKKKKLNFDINNYSKFKDKIIYIVIDKEPEGIVVENNNPSMQRSNSLKRIALSVWGTATMRNGGEDIAQLLAFLGVKPVWDGPTRKIIDLEIIPLNLLERPRVDVFLRISGLFRDAFPHLIDYVNKAQNMIASLNESSHHYIITLVHRYIATS